MKRSDEQVQELLDHLTGDLAEDTRRELEQRVLEDDELYEQLKAAEAEVVDSFLHGELSQAQERRVAALLDSSSRLRQEADIAVALDTASSLPTASTTSIREGAAPGAGTRRLGGVPRAWLVVVLLLLASAVVWLSTRMVVVERDLGRVLAEGELLQQRLEEQTEELESLRQELRLTSRRVTRLETAKRLAERSSGEPGGERP